MWRESREKAGDAWTDILRERWRDHEDLWGPQAAAG
jgi:hypothetical protein